jgi:hypothetical protein
VELAILKWGDVPDYLVLVSVIVGVIGLRWQRNIDRKKGQEERNRQAQLEDLRIGWHAVAPFYALSNGLDDNDLAQPFTHALRQLQLSGSEMILKEVDKVITSLDTQTLLGQPNSVDLLPLLEEIRAEYRRLVAVEPTSQRFLPLHVMSKEEAVRRGYRLGANSPDIPPTDKSK